MSIPEALVTAVREKRCILFAGAGLSCGLGLPLFNALTAHLSEELGLTSAADVEFPILAEYYFLKTDRHAPFMDWMRRTWHPENICIAESEPHNIIVDLDFPFIYTTNYDSWIERSYAARNKPFRKVVGVADLAEKKSGETEIIKFHGDFEFPDSIILTESSFLRRMSLEEPLDVRLRSDSLSRPILFVGYSLSDPNIRYLLYKLSQLWTEHSKGSARPNSYILMVERNEIQEQLLCERGVEPIVFAEGDPSTGMTDFFRALRDAVGAGVIKKGSAEQSCAAVSS